jgi:hypothetical protein
MSAKARLAMLEKQVGAVQMKQPRDPHQDFEDSLYEMGEGQYGFPVTAIKKAMISVAHVNKGISKEDVLRHLWLRAEIVRVRAALAGAICDVPLIRIWGDRPQMREDPVRIGTGLRRTTTLAFRAEFPRWAMRIEGEFHSPPLRAHQLRYLFEHAGMSSGLGEWRNEKSGVFGSFRMATAEEAAAWDHFAENGGDVPMSDAA